MCTECNAIEQGVIYIEQDGEEIAVCACCEMEDTMKNYDEDYGQDR